ncbi:sialidase family protein [Fulvivirgaceae bacterium BMA12]|uniref:exo-alpha-sialidase n=1 Tax=Agaribacillus aureus TaxID=3051825 RepID=A0ABT8LGD3_9BACT|nr:sialidase family protein [Fulvivirgaceae bacterium BMA12]
MYLRINLVKHVVIFQMMLFPICAFSQPHNAVATNEKIAFTNLFSADMKEGVSCYRIPALLTAKNGDLIAAIDERVPSCDDLRSNADINIVIRRSSDNGKTWSEIEPIVDYTPGESASDPSMILDKVTGEIFMFFNYMNLYGAKGEYYFKMVRSQDHGKTWSSPVDITSQISKKEWKKDFKFITSGKGIQTRSGKLLHTLVNLDRGLYIFGSDDHGKSWHLIDTPITPGDESKIIELSDGSWMINSRVNKSGLRYIHTSTDNGISWTSKPDSSLIDPGCNASLIYYATTTGRENTKRILFSNPKTSDTRENLSVQISYDEGKTWSDSKTIYTGKSAYSSMCILKNGSIGLLFEKDNYKKNVFTIISLNWLTNGKDSFKSQR